MKIGILTLPISYGYGGILQALSLYKFLENKGDNVVLINKIDFYKIPLWKKGIKKIFEILPFQNFRNIKTRYKIRKQHEVETIYQKPFINNEIKYISEELITSKDLEKYFKKEKFDAIIVGSDQVWRKAYMGNYYKNYFLDFVDSKKCRKIAYAASFGKNYWEGNGDEEEISNLLKDFKAISTREKSGVDICQNTFNFNNAKHVLDPTLLMNKTFYLNICSKYDIKKEVNGGLLTYILDESDEKKDIINFIKNLHSLTNIYNLFGFNNSNNIIYSVPEWLMAFNKADFIITDSFHGTVFSIIFNKNFVVIGNKNRGLDRFVSLLELFNLKDRMIFSLDELKEKKLKNINYKKVNEILKQEQIKSLNFLDLALNK